MPTLTLSDIRIEQRDDTLGIGTATPRISWRTATDIPAWLQAGYQIELYRDGALHGDTGRVDSAESVLLAWPFAPLVSRQQVQLRVRVWGVAGGETPWSEFIPIEVGLLAAADWQAQFITPAWAEDTSKPQPAALLRNTFTVRPDLVQARLYISALGVFEAQLNGAVVGDHILDPGWTSYSHRLRYQTFDVTAMLHEGPNAIGATVAEGWYRGRLGFGSGRRNLYGEQIALLAQLELHYADGTSEQVATDQSWLAATGPILASEIYDGETYDARLERDGWATAGYDTTGWSAVRIVEHDFTTLFAPVGPPVRRIEEVAPVAIFQSPSGKTIIDFGQNLVGWLRISAQGPAGHTITLRHAEVLEHGELGTRPLRYAAATDRYTLHGNGLETWQPRFTFHGFRYAEIEGWPGELRAEDLRAIVCHSDMQRTGWFECSDPLVNQLHANVVWGMRGNFFDLPTDCPQRDERLGWTGDIQVFSPTASFLYDCAGFLQSWLADLAAEQKQAGGVVPVVVPNVLGSPFPAAAWGDAAVVVPWVLYQRYGDLQILASQFESMHTWVDAVEALAGETRLWDQGFQFGDWLDPSAPPEKPAAARAHPSLVATAYFARSAELVASAAQVLGRSTQEAHYRQLAAEIRAAFAREYVTTAGRLMSDAPTAYALALEFNLFPEAHQRQYAATRLVELVRGDGYRIGTGFVGTPIMCDALSNAGMYHAAYRLLLQRECPSWLYSVSMGATTIWERWDSMLPDGSINPGEMTSFNHYALGAVADWLHRVVAGLAPAAPAYRHMQITPRPGGGLTNARARHATPYGIAECSWRIEAGQIAITLVVPPNTTADVTLPGSDTPTFAVGSGTHQWQYPYQDPDARAKPGLDDKISAVIDDHATWQVVVAAIQQALPGSPFVIGMLQSQSRIPLRVALSRGINAEAVLAAVEQALLKQSDTAT